MCSESKLEEDPAWFKHKATSVGGFMEKQEQSGNPAGGQKTSPCLFGHIAGRSEGFEKPSFLNLCLPWEMMLYQSLTP